MASPAAAQLATDLQQLAANPHDLPTLIDAGHAALALDDVGAARGFFERARAIAPDDGKVLAGLALVSLRQNDPVAALELFRRAGAAGADIDQYAAQRGLAQDLVGNNALAQRLYQRALAKDNNEETVRRLALSYAIAGDQAASEATLLPLLQQRNLAAYRTRAFALAILGKQKQAVSIIETMLPGDMAHQLIPYMRTMPRLTRAQQAAAANLGRFPRPGQIGRDDPRVMHAALEARQTARAGVSAKPLTTRAEQVRAQQERSHQSPVPGASGELPALASARASQTPPPPPRRPAAAIPPPPPLPTPTPAASGRTALGKSFAYLANSNRPPPSKVRSGAVDVTKITPAREKPVKKHRPPPVPSREWVQVGTGRNIRAFKFTWHRLVRRAGRLLSHKKPYRAAYGRTNRLVTGPFRSAAEAQRLVRELKKKGISSFRFTSARGQAVLPVR